MNGLNYYLKSNLIKKTDFVVKFTYLGSTLSRAVHIDDEVTARTAKASVAFGRLRKKCLGTQWNQT